MSTPTLACDEKERLIHEILEAHKQIASFQIQKIESVVAGRTETENLLTELKKARETRRVLMEQLREHIEEHRC
jgi:hypothetical protein